MQDPYLFPDGFDCDSDCFAATDAKRGDSAAATALTQCVKKGHDNSRAGRADRMS
jgi:hypothetical protein